MGRLIIILALLLLGWGGAMLAMLWDVILWVYRP